MLNLKELRKELHKIPELGFQEYKTQKLLIETIKKISDQLIIHTFENHTGFIVEYSFGSGSYQLFRADMDALQIMEENEIEFCSTHQGYMHACGHDIHMTILVGLIEKVVKNNLKQNILFVFQPAEEGQGGAKKLLESGIFSQYDIKEAYALHVTGDLPVGTVSTKSGIFFGIPQEFEIIFTGKSSHVAFPHQSKDALSAGVHFYQTMESLLGLKFAATESVIFRVGKFNAGTAMNIIPGKCTLEGTTRNFTKENWEKLNNLISHTAKEIAKIYELDVDVKFYSTYDPVINSERLYQKFKNGLSDEIQFIEAEAVMTGEDFGFFTSVYDGLLFWLGAGKIGVSLHNPNFLPNEDCIDIGINAFWSVIDVHTD